MPVKQLSGAAQAAFGDEKPTRIAVAVSGGSDSVAALHLMADHFAVEAVTVDHALRSGSAAEADWVGRLCAGLGVPHQVLIWQHGVVQGNLMDAARHARYALMAAWAAKRGISHIVLGHTADDQAETFLMGLARRAGIDGLVGMRVAFDLGGVRFLRPFLGVTRQALRMELQRRGVDWLDDPSNENDQFTRVKARRVLTALQPLGLSVEGLSGVVANLTQAQGAVRAAVRDAAPRICSEQAGEVVFDTAQWLITVPEVQRRMLVLALTWIAGPVLPRGSGVDRVLAAIAQGRDTTLAGCRIRAGQARFRVVREPRAVAGLVTRAGIGGAVVWDGRWQVDGPFDADVQVRALGADGLLHCKEWRRLGISRDALLVSPAIWSDTALIAAPFAGFSAGFSARIVAGFDQFAVSH